MKAINEHDQSVLPCGEDCGGIGKHPESADAIRGSDTVKVYPELGEVIQTLVDYYLHRSRREQPMRKHRPMMEVS